VQTGSEGFAPAPRGVTTGHHSVFGTAAPVAHIKRTEWLWSATPIQAIAANEYAICFPNSSRVNTALGAGASFGVE
jgi:hypothetical protein